MDEPIRTYQETRLELRRRFDLFPDRVQVTGQGLHFGRFDETVPLAMLQPQPARVWIRGVLFQYGKSALIFAACVAGGTIIGYGPEALTEPWVGGIIGLLASVGLILALVYGRPVEFVRFRTDAGVFALDVARVGPQAQDFDEFTDLITQLIQRARAAT